MDIKEKKPGLVLTRKVGQTIMVETPSGELIEITIIRIKGQEARVFLHTDRSVKINRKEVYDDIKNGVPRAPKGDS